MTVKIQLLAITLAVFLAVSVVTLTRKKMIRTQYTLFWLLMCGAFLFLSLFVDVLYDLAQLLGVYSPVNAVFIVAFVCILLLLFNFSVIVSGLSHENRKLILKLSLLTWRVEQLEKGKLA